MSEARAALAAHWPEYAMEAFGLAVFMVAACLFPIALFHPAVALVDAGARPLLARGLMGVAMGLTAIAITYSPWGRQSGAHLNPCITLAFLCLGRIAPWDAAFYAVAQVAGGLAGVLLSAAIAPALVAHPAVRFAVTVPGPLGPGAAFAAEAAISALLMATVLAASAAPRTSRFAGLFAGGLVAAYICFEAPLSGMSMNPARSLASALPAGVWTAFWIYLTAPPLGMVAAAGLWARRRPRAHGCAKVVHEGARRCIFCGAGVPRVTRRSAAAAAAFGVVALLCGGAAAAGAPAPGAPPGPGASALAPERGAAVGLRQPHVVDGVDAILSIGMTVADAERSIAFYRDVLGFAVIADVEVDGAAWEHLQGVFGVRMRVVRMRLGGEEIELAEYLAPRGRPIPADSRSNDRWFQHAAIVVSDMDRAYAVLRRHRVEHASSGPQTLPDWNPQAAGIRAFYFKDPDGHPLEAIQFPAGKGEARWHAAGDRVFLGIDHTAIVVADTEASLGFYRDRLGLAVAGTSENHGSEQEHLNNVFGARLRITALRAAAGPGIELLEYLAPRDGRPYPADARANDLLHWQTRLAARGDAIALPAGARLVSPGVVRLADSALGFGSGATLRDPDGHVLQIVAPGGGAAAR